MKCYSLQATKQLSRHEVLYVNRVLHMYVLYVSSHRKMSHIEILIYRYTCKLYENKLNIENLPR